jgi:hypothetical protein
MDKCRDGMAVMVDVHVDRSSSASLPGLGSRSLGYETLVDLIDVLLDIGYNVLGSLLILLNGAKRWQSREIHIPENVTVCCKAEIRNVAHVIIGGNQARKEEVLFGGEVQVLQKRFLGSGDQLVSSADGHCDALNSFINHDVTITSDEDQAARIWGLLAHKSKAGIGLICAVVNSPFKFDQNGKDMLVQNRPWRSVSVPAPFYDCAGQLGPGFRDILLQFSKRLSQ